MNEEQLQESLLRLMASRAQIDEQIIATRNLINGFKAGVESTKVEESQPEE